MNPDSAQTEIFEQHRPRLRGIAYRMLGARGERFDAILSDMSMPDMTGIDPFNAVMKQDAPLAQRMIARPFSRRWPPRKPPRTASIACPSRIPAFR
jgi:CheY-like chemotaxis protein